MSDDKTSAQSAVAATKQRDELELIESVLLGFPNCIARSDGLRAVRYLMEAQAKSLQSSAPVRSESGESFIGENDYRELLLEILCRSDAKLPTDLRDGINRALDGFVRPAAAHTGLSAELSSYLPDLAGKVHLSKEVFAKIKAALGGGVALNLTSQSIVEWASGWVSEDNRARFAEALAKELRDMQVVNDELREATGTESAPTVECCRGLAPRCPIPECEGQTAPAGGVASELSDLYHKANLPGADAWDIAQETAKLPDPEPAHVSAVRMIVNAWDAGRSFEDCVGILEQSVQSAKEGKSK